MICAPALGGLEGRGSFVARSDLDANKVQRLTGAMHATSELRGTVAWGERQGWDAVAKRERGRDGITRAGES
jgi:hypothetical protein